MKNKQMMYTFASAIVLIIIVFGYMIIKAIFVAPNDIAMVNYISNQTRSDGYIFDSDGSIGVQGIEDINYDVDRDMVFSIKFGNIKFDVKPEDLKDEEFAKSFKKTMLSIKEDKLYYKGKEVVE